MEGIILAQQKVYGYNFVQEIMDEKISLELEKYVKMNLDDSYQVPVPKLYANMLNAEVTARDRETLLEIAADEGQVHFIRVHNMLEQELCSKVLLIMKMECLKCFAVRK